MVDAEINSKKCTLNVDTWTVQGDDPDDLKKILDTEVLTYWDTAPGYHPDRERHVAEYVVGRLGGRILTPKDPPADDGLVY